MTCPKTKAYEIVVRELTAFLSAASVRCLEARLMPDRFGGCGGFHRG